MRDPSEAGSVPMHLRDHPKLRWHRVRVWPPPWLGPRAPDARGPIGEQGILREVECFPALPSIPARLGLSIEYEGRRFTGVLFLDDADFLVSLYDALRGCLGRPIAGIGSLEVEG